MQGAGDDDDEFDNEWEKALKAARAVQPGNPVWQYKYTKEEGAYRHRGSEKEHAKMVFQRPGAKDCDMMTAVYDDLQQTKLETKPVPQLT